MAEYINRDMLLREIDGLPRWWCSRPGEWEPVPTDCGAPKEWHDNAALDPGDVRGCIEDAQPADVVPVRHGRWKHLLEFYWECSECGTFGLDTDLYCRNCGAKMDGGHGDG